MDAMDTVTGGADLTANAVTVSLLSVIFSPMLVVEFNSVVCYTYQCICV